MNVPQPPSAPANLLGTVNGDFIALAWKNTFAGGAPTNVVLDVSGALATTIPLGATDAFTFAGVPPGTYTLSLRALNGAGASPSSNPITLTFPGACSGVPQAPANLLAYRVGSTIFVTWDPAASGPAPTAFILNVSGSFVGSFGTAWTRTERCRRPWFLHHQCRRRQPVRQRSRHRPDYRDGTVAGPG